MKTRKALQELKFSPNVKNYCSQSSEMASPTKMSVVEESVENIEAPKRAKKENVSVVRRSKRKNELKRASDEISKSINKISKTKSKNKALSMKTDSITDANQSKIIPFLSTNQSSTCLKPEKLIQSDNGNISANITEEVSQMTTDSVSGNVAEEISLMTSDSTSENYWQQLAEQRRLALKEALLENESLNDQVEVLKAENLQLKSALDAAEKLLQQEGLLD